MGFIFYPKSPRYVGEAFKVPDISHAVKRVGVFVNEATELIVEKAVEYQLDYLQLHGDETIQQCEDLRNQGRKVIKVFSVDDQMDFAVTRPYESVVDFFLFDTKGKYYGGNSRSFDWKILANYEQRVPFFLSGGIGLENMSTIKSLQGMNLHAIDLNSGVETGPAMKDVKKIKQVQGMLNNLFPEGKKATK